MKMLQTLLDNEDILSNFYTENYSYVRSQKTGIMNLFKKLFRSRREDIAGTKFNHKEIMKSYISYKESHSNDIFDDSTDLKAELNDEDPLDQSR